MEAIKVCIRFRAKEEDSQDFSKWSISDSLKTCYLEGEAKKERTFAFDHICPPNASQEAVYEIAARENILQYLEGYNNTIFAYGQTASGKTFTMLGPEEVFVGLLSDEPLSEKTQESLGIIPRSIDTIFNAVLSGGLGKGIEFTMKVSYIEVYMESINDILMNPPTPNLKIREYPRVGMVVVGLEERYVTNVEEVYECLATGSHNRMVGATNQNQRSSRSHTVFILSLEQKFLDGSSKISKLNLVDLAGTEKVNKTGAKGQTLEEAKKINQSLSCLGLCILALSSKKKQTHIPYRDSKLTLILKESLGGNSKTTLICTCSMKLAHEDETINTLKFAQRAKKIKTKAVTNINRSTVELEALVESLKKEVSFLRRELKSNGIDISNKLIDECLVSEKINNFEESRKCEISNEEDLLASHMELLNKYKHLQEYSQIEIENLRSELEQRILKEEETKNLHANEQIENLKFKIMEMQRLNDTIFREYGEKKNLIEYEKESGRANR